MLRPPKTAPFRHLDVAGGTGDVAFRILDAGGPATSVTVFDINASMLGVGEERAAKGGYSDRCAFVEGNAEELPFEDRSFDGYTIAFGIRNVPRIQVALNEAYRVLKRGGRFLCLEFAPSRCRCSTAFMMLIPSTSSAHGCDGHRRWRTLSLSRGIDPPVPAPRCLLRDDPRGGFCARVASLAHGWHREHPFRLEALRQACSEPLVISCIWRASAMC